MHKLRNFISIAMTFIQSFFKCHKTAVVNPVTVVLQNRVSNNIHFLKSCESYLKNIFHRREFITVNGGGKLKVGDQMTGFSNISFEPGNLSHDLAIDFNWDSHNFVAQFGPSGTVFEKPVKIKLSYKNADLSKIDESELRVWHFNEREQLWELCGDVVNRSEKYVEGQISHFSRFAIGVEIKKLTDK